jgi:ribulose 1,5-bisphosphate carboxylase large subunit-like protein
MMDIDDATKKAMMMMPIPENRNVEQRWPSSAKNASTETWQTVWPNNLDDRKTCKMGRKIKVADAGEEGLGGEFRCETGI